jgi:hypothetical protein
MLRKAVDGAGPRAAERDVRFDLDAESIVVAHADADRSGQAVDNLISNALKYTPPGGHIEVRLERRDGDAVIAVADTGIGMGQADVERLFERFFRASTAVDDAIPGSASGWRSSTCTAATSWSRALTARAPPGNRSGLTRSRRGAPAKTKTRRMGRARLTAEMLSAPGGRPRRHNLRPPLVFAAAMVCVLVATGCGNTRAKPHPGTELPTNRARDRFGVFRRPVTPADAISRPGRGALEAAFGPRYGIDMDQARRVPAYSASVKVWLVPGRDGICTFVQHPYAEGPGGGCDPISKVETGVSATTVTASPDHVEVFGVVPDGVTEVQLSLADGSTETLQVNDNVYSALERSATKSVSFDAPTGHVTVDASSFTG